MTSLAPVMEGFFTRRLIQRRVSPHTIASYRDCFRLLLGYAQQTTGKQPAQLDIADLDAELIAGFLDHLEHDRAAGISTCNLRLTAIRSLFSYASLNCPDHQATIQRVLAIPPKRRNHTLVAYLTDAEVDALLAAPDRASPLGRRDHALLVVAVQTGLRVSELTGLTCADVTYGIGANVYTTGKGRKDRRTPLTPSTARLLQAWVRQRNAQRDDPVFPAIGERPMSTDAVEDLVDKHVRSAAKTCPSIAAKRVTPHTLRHTCAMNMLHGGIDQATIALWLGHANTRATDIYIHADMTTKERALERTAPTPAAARRYRPPDKLLAFLEAL